MADLDFARQTVLVRASYTLGRSGPPKSGQVRSVPLIDQAAPRARRAEPPGPVHPADDLVFCTDLAGTSAPTLLAMGSTRRSSGRHGRPG